MLYFSIFLSLLYPLPIFLLDYEKNPQKVLKE